MRQLVRPTGIPTLNEAAQIDAVIAGLLAEAPDGTLLVVADGGPQVDEEYLYRVVDALDAVAAAVIIERWLAAPGDATPV